MSEIIPFWTSHFSLGQSLLTLRPVGKSKPHGPKSILDIANKMKMQEIFLVESSMGGFLTAFNNCVDAKIQLCFGLKLVVCNDVANKSDNSRETESKVIIFLRNSNGYKNLIKIWNAAATQHFYYYPRCDWQLLRKFWSDDLLLVFPFYSSFLARNTLGLYSCVADHGFCQPIFTIEDSALPFDGILKDRVDKYCEANKLRKLESRSVYYNRYSDFDAFFTLQCIHNRTNWEKPNLDHFASNRFCVEDYEQKVSK